MGGTFNKRTNTIWTWGVCLTSQTPQLTFAPYAAYKVAFIAVLTYNRLVKCTKTRFAFSSSCSINDKKFCLNTICFVCSFESIRPNCTGPSAWVWLLPSRYADTQHIHCHWNVAIHSLCTHVCIYSGTPLIYVYIISMGQIKVSILARCTYFRGY